MPKTIILTRWTVEKASPEFDINPRTLSKRLKQLGIDPGPDGKFTTMDICAAVFGDYRGEQLREIREKANKLELENAETRGELVPVEMYRSRLDRVFTIFRQKVLACSMTDEEKHELFEDLGRGLKAGRNRRSISENGFEDASAPDSQPMGG